MRTTLRLAAASVLAVGALSLLTAPATSATSGSVEQELRVEQEGVPTGS